MAYTKYSLTPSSNTAAPPDGAPEGMLPSAVNDTMRDMMAQIRDCGDGIRGGTYTMTAPIITGGTINGATIGATTASTGKFTAVTNSALTSGRVTYAGTAGVLQDDADFTFNGTTVTMANDASISGLTVGKGGSAISTNTAVGASALNANTSGASNTAVGDSSSVSTTTGTQNTSVGRFSLRFNTTGGNNVAVGSTALYTNTTGGSNTALGTDALQLNTTASNNTAVGYQAGYSNTTGTELTAIGYKAAYATTGSSNTAIGYNALVSNTSGTGNTGVGSQPLYSNTTGVNNSALGVNSLVLNTTGSYNSAFGQSALYNNTTASNNTAVGYQALEDNTTGTNNCAVGRFALRNCTTGTENTALGTDAGDAVTTGTDNTLVGYGSGYLITTGSKNSVLGAYSGNQGGLDIRTASNHIVLSDGDGNPRLFSDNTGKIVINNPAVLDTSRLTLQMSSGDNAMSIRSYDSSSSVMMMQFYTAANSRIGYIQTTSGTATVYSTSSDYRLKENIAPMTGALDKVALLKPCTYTWKSNGEDSQGFIAHELAEVVPDCVQGEKDAVDAEGKPIYQGIDTSFLVATLAASIQELKAIVDAQAERIAVLEAK